jgi:hypothetical protein
MIIPEIRAETKNLPFRSEREVAKVLHQREKAVMPTGLVR